MAQRRYTGGEGPGSAGADRLERRQANPRFSNPNASIARPQYRFTFVHTLRCKLVTGSGSAIPVSIRITPSPTKSRPIGQRTSTDIIMRFSYQKKRFRTSAATSAMAPSVIGLNHQ